MKIPSYICPVSFKTAAAMAALFLTAGLYASQANSTNFKVISLSPHTTELAYEAGLGESLIAVSAYSDYPTDAQKLEQVADFKSVNIERIIYLQPDLILAWKGGNPDRALSKLEKLGFTLFYSSPKSLEDVANNIEILSQYSSNPVAVKKRAEALKQSIKTLKKANQNKAKVRYFYQIASTPLMTHNGEHWPQALFSICGGENIFAKSPVPYPKVNKEQVIFEKPQAFFFSDTASQALDEWQDFQDYIPALQDQNIFSLTTSWLNRPTSRSLKVITQICNAFDLVREKQLLTSINTGAVSNNLDIYPKLLKMQESGK